MGSEYIIAGRRPLPETLCSPWSWSFEFGGDDDDDVAFDEGGFQLDELRPRGNKDFFAFVEKHAGFKPVSIVTIRGAAWNFSRAAAEVLAGALDGVCFVDTLVDEHGLEPAVKRTKSAGSIAELQQRIEAALRKAETFFARWEKLADQQQADEDRRDPAGAAQRASENDWSDV